MPVVLNLSRIMRVYWRLRLCQGGRNCIRKLSNGDQRSSSAGKTHVKRPFVVPTGIRGEQEGQRMHVQSYRQGSKRVELWQALYIDVDACRFERQRRVASDRFWPIPAPHNTVSERPLLMRADIQNFDFRKLTGERLVSTRKQTVE